MNRELYKRIKIIRAGIHIEGTAEAPKGYVWKASRTHEIVSSCYRGKGDLKAITDDLKERIDYGIVECDDVNCEWCNDI